MTRKFLALFLSIFFLLISTKIILADYATSYQSYIDTTGNYQSAYNGYLTARASYFASGNLDSEDKARAATLKMLQSRNNVVVSYLNAVNAKVQATLGLDDGDKSSLQNQINTENSWYTAHTTKLNSAGSLQDLVSDSDEAKSQFQNSTQITIYQNLIAMGVANNSYIRGEIVNEINTLQLKIDEIKSNQDKDTSVVERSLVDVKNKISRSQDKDNLAKNLVGSIKPQNSQGNNDFTDAQSYLADSNSYLKEANQGLLQIIIELKSAN
ncbi:hypothetical protein BH10PAT1_BH10PAT1_0620 [soil metagenome]